MHLPPRTHLAARGFTLIELLVAIAIMAVLAMVSWRGIDSMARAQAQMRERADAVLTLQSALAQWNSDLDAAVAITPTRAIDWNGQVLRITRGSPAGEPSSLTVVAWTLRGGNDGVARWTRWQSPPLGTRGEWQQAWDGAAAWASGGSGSFALGNSSLGGSEVALMPVTGWRLLYFRNDLWAPAVGYDALGANEKVPNGVRLLIELPPGPGLSGLLSLDWARPNLTQLKS